jgi:hypothetical protein
LLVQVVLVVAPELLKLVVQVELVVARLPSRVAQLMPETVRVVAPGQTRLVELVEPVLVTQVQQELR